MEMSSRVDFRLLFNNRLLLFRLNKVFTVQNFIFLRTLFCFTNLKRQNPYENLFNLICYYLVSNFVKYTFKPYEVGIGITDQKISRKYCKFILHLMVA